MALGQFSQKTPPFSTGVTRKRNAAPTDQKEKHSDHPEFFQRVGCKWQTVSPPKVTIWTLQDARDADGVTLKMTFLLVHKKGQESTARASYLHSHKDSVFTGEKKRGIKRGRKRSC